MKYIIKHLPLVAFLLVAPALAAQEDEAKTADSDEVPEVNTENDTALLQDVPVLEVPVEDGPPLIVIELIANDRELNGVLLDTEDLEIETAFGPAKIPLAKVLGIRLAREATDITTVVLHNGDMITGMVDIQSMMIQTNWGKSEVNGVDLASIFFKKGLAWKSLDLLAGPRWTLIEEDPETGAATMQPRSQALAQQ